MGCSRASHFSHVSASAPGGSRMAKSPSKPPLKMRSSNGGWHGLASWGCFRGLPETGAGLRADDGANSLPDARSSLAAANLCLAELRSVSEISGTEGFSFLLAGEAGRTAVLGNGRALQTDQAR